MRKTFVLALLCLVGTSCDNEEDPCLENLEAQTRLVLENLEGAQSDTVCNTAEGVVACSFAGTMACLLDEGECNRNTEDAQVDANEVFAYGLRDQLRCLEQR